MLSLLLLLLALYPATLPDEGMLGVEFDERVAVMRVLPDVDEIEVGDVVLSVAGVRVTSLPQALALCRRPAGSVAAVEVRRDSRVETLELTWRPIPTAVIAELEEATRAKRSAVPGVVEKVEGKAIGVVLEQPVARAFAPGALVGLIPDATVVGEARVTRVVTSYRLEAELRAGSEARVWDRVVVTP